MLIRFLTLVFSSLDSQGPTNNSSNVSAFIHLCKHAPYFAHTYTHLNCWQIFINKPGSYGNQRVYRRSQTLWNMVIIANDDSPVGAQIWRMKTVNSGMKSTNLMKGNCCTACVTEVWLKSLLSYLVICRQPEEQHLMSYTGGDHGRDPSSPAGRRDICGVEHKETNLGHYLDRINISIALSLATCWMVRA